MEIKPRLFVVAEGILKEYPEVTFENIKEDYISMPIKDIYTVIRASIATNVDINHIKDYIIENIRSCTNSNQIFKVLRDEIDFINTCTFVDFIKEKYENKEDRGGFETYEP